MLPLNRGGISLEGRSMDAPFLWVLGMRLPSREYSGLVFPLLFLRKECVCVCVCLSLVVVGGVWWVMVAGGCGGQWVMLFGGGGGG